MMDFKDIMDVVYCEYVTNGYEEKWNSYEDKELADVTELALIIVEISESMDVIFFKAKDKKELASELADIVIRTMNFARRKGIDLEQAVIRKNLKNLERGHLQGKLKKVKETENKTFAETTNT